MPENTQRVSVGGFSFENKDEAEQAKKEIEGIRYIKTKTNMSDPEVILQVYNKMIGQKLFETAVGYSYLKDLQEYLTTIPFIKNEDILPIPVTHPRLEESLKKQKREIAQKERVRAVRARQREKNLAKIDRKALETESSGKLQILSCSFDFSDFCQSPALIKKKNRKKSKISILNTKFYSLFCIFQSLFMTTFFP